MSRARRVDRSVAEPPPPFPRSLAYEPDDDWWACEITPPGFDRIGIGPVASRPGRRVVTLIIEAGTGGPSHAQVAAYEHLRANGAGVIRTCLAAVARTAEEYRPGYADWHPPGVLDGLLPPGVTPGQLRTRLAPTTVQISGLEADGVAYVANHFDCAWDQEHGYPVVLHGDRPIYSGLSGSGWAPD